jgi:hypothetical protein
MPTGAPVSCLKKMHLLNFYQIHIKISMDLEVHSLYSWTKSALMYFILSFHLILTDGIFETGAYGVPSKSQNPTILGQGGPSSTQCSNPSWA